MKDITKRFYDEIIAAMDKAEEMQGPEGQEYIDLMGLIEKEAHARKWTCWANSLPLNTNTYTLEITHQ